MVEKQDHCHNKGSTGNMFSYLNPLSRPFVPNQLNQGDGRDSPAHLDSPNQAFASSGSSPGHPLPLRFVKNPYEQARAHMMRQNFPPGFTRFYKDGENMYQTSSLQGSTTGNQARADMNQVSPPPSRLNSPQHPPDMNQVSPTPSNSTGCSGSTGMDLACSSSGFSTEYQARTDMNQVSPPYSNATRYGGSTDLNQVTAPLRFPNPLQSPQCMEGTNQASSSSSFGTPTSFSFGTHTSSSSGYSTPSSSIPPTGHQASGSDTITLKKQWLMESAAIHQVHKPSKSRFFPTRSEGEIEYKLKDMRSLSVQLAANHGPPAVGPCAFCVERGHVCYLPKTTSDGPDRCFPCRMNPWFDCRGLGNDESRRLAKVYQKALVNKIKGLYSLQDLIKQEMRKENYCKGEKWYSDPK